MGNSQTSVLYLIRPLVECKWLGPVASAVVFVTGKGNFLAVVNTTADKTDAIISLFPTASGLCCMGQYVQMMLCYVTQLGYKKI